MKAKLTALSCMLAAAGLASPLAMAQEKVKIGFVTDMSSLYADVEGKNAVTAMQMAIDDFGGKVLGQPIELLSADHQNKADIAASKVREWVDTQGISLVFSGTNSGTALAVSQVANEKKRVHFNSGAGSSALTNEQCNPYTVHYAYDTVALAKGTGTAVVERGGKDWFFLTADYAFGHALENDTTAVIKAKGGKVVGGVKHPLSTQDFSSFLLQAQASKAKIIGLANAGGATIADGSATGTVTNDDAAAKLPALSVGAQVLLHTRFDASATMASSLPRRRQRPGPRSRARAG